MHAGKVNRHEQSELPDLNYDLACGAPDGTSYRVGAIVIVSVTDNFGTQQGRVAPNDGTDDNTLTLAGIGVPDGRIALETCVTGVK